MQTISFPATDVHYHFQSSFGKLKELYNTTQCIIITDEQINSLYNASFKDHKVITIPTGESQKNLQTIAALTDELLSLEATRHTILIGVGGGVITDITGFLAATYMRGVKFGLVPTTLLGMVDAAIGGKNGVNTGLHKNIIGTITQPSFILYDTVFLKTLPIQEWSNGFAEIIKYACIFDKGLFEELEQRDIEYYQNNDNALQTLIERCAAWKNKTVLADEKETGERKLLNFGHTAGHAIEKLYALPHGAAVAIGMIIACMVSQEITGFDASSIQRLIALLQNYELPVSRVIDTKSVMELLHTDKKRNITGIDYIVLESIGKGVIKNISFDTIEDALNTYSKG